ncbi:DUF3027 domain-containing protein [Amycolatopsis sp. FBCC-B4732]|uniref:DUF3027 domain-containing protein n=1 Tax=Amycolatopsis sp. FBCC-B4732 TaxID=3079339 RepID=UPI0028F45BCD|nr:DUF3027 domain-containing protein [Amycolatopsis sp. FBCC-B4732]
MTLLLTLDDGSVQRKLADAVEFARAAVLDEAPEDQLGAHVGVTREDAVTASHLFEAQVPGYGGWRWSVTVALAGDEEPVTVSEVVLVPGPDALIAPPWVPWERRVRAGDLGVGDIFPTDENDPRLAPAYLQSDDPAVEEVSRDAGLGRVHVLSRYGRTEAATRWHSGEFGPRSDMARSAPDVCGTCGFFVQLAGSLSGVFGVCSNDIAPADGHVVDVEYGCGAHSEIEVEVTSSVPVAELVYDDSLLDFTPAPEPVAETPEPVAEPVEPVAETSAVEPEADTPAEAELAVAEPVVETSAAEPETAVAESDVSPAEVEPEAAEAATVVEAEAAGAVAEPTQAEVTDAVVEPEAADAVAEPTQAEVTDAVAEPAVAGPAQAEVAEGEPEVAAPAEAEPTQAEVTDAVAEPVVAGAEQAVAEPAQAEVTGAAAEPVVEADVTGAVEAEPAEQQTEAVEEVDLPEAVLADNVVTEEPATQARIDGAGEQSEH